MNLRFWRGAWPLGWVIALSACAARSPAAPEAPFLGTVIAVRPAVAAASAAQGQVLRALGQGRAASPSAEFIIRASDGRTLSVAPGDTAQLRPGDAVLVTPGEPTLLRRCVPDAAVACSPPMS